MFRGRRSRFKRTSTSQGVFDPKDTKNVRHTRLGVWDLYQEREPMLAKLPGGSYLEIYYEMIQSLPYVWKMLQDISAIKGCWFLLCCFIVIEVVESLIPAMSLWYSGQLLRIVEVSLERRTLEPHKLFSVLAGSIVCMLLTKLLELLRNRVVAPLTHRIKLHFSTHIFHAMARLDVPTFADPIVQGQLESAWSTRNPFSSVSWDLIYTLSGCVAGFLKLTSQAAVLFDVLHDKPDGLLLAALSFGPSAMNWVRSMTARSAGAWAATTRDQDYIRWHGLKKLVSEPAHRQEIVAGNMAEYLTSRYKRHIQNLGDSAEDFHSLQLKRVQDRRFRIWNFFTEPLRELPQIVFTFRAVQYPASIPVTLASLHLIQQSTMRFTDTFLHLIERTTNVAEVLGCVRRLYEIETISNKILDGQESYPENQQSLHSGISVEFRSVSFKYPGSEEYALRNVSFQVGQGQLCVIVGSNGSGKSTILKLICRLYDPTEGHIFFDGRDIRTLKLGDLRKALSVLFQDYSYFPLSIAENIGLGDPENVDDEDMIHQAAELGGAKHFIEQLPDGFATYLDPPVQDYYSGIPQGTKTLFGKPIDYNRIRGAGSFNNVTSTGLSGGQMQRLALSRTFMHSLVSTSGVGLLLFDEPSASLDPTAEHDLFQRLCDLRGSKTMIFSSHRFGQLTRKADLILYMDDAEVLEIGTHEELLKYGGEYARIWLLQAQTFL